MKEDERYKEEDERYKELHDNDMDTRPYLMETAAEIAEPLPFRGETENTTDENNGRIQGYIGLALSILAFFVWPVVFGIAGIILGFVARRRGAEGLGMWAIGLGAVAIILGIFVLPFF